MTATCACGSVSVTIEDRPAFIFDCNCTMCRKTGAAWGYFQPEAVHTEGTTSAYSRTDKPSPAVAVHSCPSCGSTTHWVRTGDFIAGHGNDMAGVNMRLFDPDALTGIEVQYPDGKNWSGDGAFGFRRPALTISEETPW